ncbi:unnamed protein product [Camellia sinensis]
MMVRSADAAMVLRNGVCDHLHKASAEDQFQYGFANLDDDDDGALTQFHHMLRMRPLPSIVQFNQLLTSIARTKRYSTVISLFRKMNLNLLKLGYEPDTTTFTTLIKGFCLNGNMASAVKFFDEIVENGFQPNFVTYGTIINGLCKIGNTSAAILLLRKMEEIGGFEPGLVEYSTVIDRLYKDKLVTEAFKLFSEMIGKGFSPNVVTYTSLIQSVCSLGEWKEAIRLLNEMVGKNIWPNVQTFTILVDALCKEGKAKEAQVVVQLIIQRGVVPDVVTYSAVMDGYCLCGQVDEARKMFDVMVSRGCAPNVFAYNILINGYCKIKNIDEAMNLFKEMSRKGLLPDTITYTTLIGGLCQTRRPQDALLLLDEMQTYGQIPNLFTYSTLLDGLCNNQYLDEALALFEKIETAGLVPNIVCQLEDKMDRHLRRNTTHKHFKTIAIELPKAKVNNMLTGCERTCVMKFGLLLLMMGSVGTLRLTVVFIVAKNGFLITHLQCRSEWLQHDSWLHSTPSEILKVCDLTKMTLNPFKTTIDNNKTLPPMKEKLAVSNPLMLEETISLFETRNCGLSNSNYKGL